MIQDAPYITEAERIGYPTGDFQGSDDAYICASDFHEAVYHIDKAVANLIRAADRADKHGKAKPVDEIISRLEDLECMIKSVRDDFTGRRCAG